MASGPPVLPSPCSHLPLHTVIEGDCREVLGWLPERSVDLIFADPPYNLQLRQELWRPNLTRVDAVDDAWDQFATFEEYDAFTRAWLVGCRHVLKDTGTLWVIGTYHNIHRVGAILMDLGFWILNEVVWVKVNPMPNFRGVRFTNAHETLIWAQKRRGTRYTFNHHAMKALNDGRQQRSDWHIPLCTGAERLRVDGAKAHATQKPEALLYRVLLASSNPGDVVLDPFLGSGTTAAVAHRLGRRWIGIERDPAYVALARQRLAALPPPDDAALAVRRPRPPRIPFGTLLERGLLQPGDELTLGDDGPRATVLADGQLRCDGLVGSIHQVSSALRQAPCNGWDHWRYQDPHTGQRHPIDRLRRALAEADGLGQAE